MSLTHAERGRLGGLATFNKYGRPHMVAIGKIGFARLATFARGGRKAALGILVSRGRIRPPWTDLSPAQERELYRTVGLDD